MKQVSIRDLRQNASQWLRLVQQGERFEITDRGRPVAMLVPVPQGNVIQQLIASGRATPALGRLEDLGPALPPRRGQPTLSEILEEMRADER